MWCWTDALFGKVQSSGHRKCYTGTVQGTGRHFRIRDEGIKEGTEIHTRYQDKGPQDVPNKQSPLSVIVTMPLIQPQEQAFQDTSFILWAARYPGEAKDRKV